MIFKRSRKPNGLLLILLVSAAASTSADAQGLPTWVDSVALDLSSRLIWRALDRGHGLSARGQLSLGLAGFTVDQSSRNNLTLETETWFPITNRDVRRTYDQTRAALRYGRCVLACDRIAWGRKRVFSVEAAEYFRPNDSLERTSAELLAALEGEWQVEKLRGRQFGGLFYPYIRGARSSSSTRRTYVEIGMGTQTPSVHGVAAFIGVDAAASDYATQYGVSRSFGYHSWGGSLGANTDVPLPEFRRLTIRLQIIGNRVRGSLGRSSIEHGVFFKIY